MKGKQKISGECDYCNQLTQVGKYIIEGETWWYCDDCLLEINNKKEKK